MFYCKYLKRQNQLNVYSKKSVGETKDSIGDREITSEITELDRVVGLQVSDVKVKNALISIIVIIAYSLLLIVMLIYIQIKSSL